MDGEGGRPKGKIQVIGINFLSGAPGEVKSGIYKFNMAGQFLCEFYGCCKRLQKEASFYELFVNSSQFEKMLLWRVKIKKRWHNSDIHVRT